jgi:hypothetical protein
VQSLMEGGNDWLPASASAHLSRLVSIVNCPEEPAAVIPHGGICEEREG